MVNLIINGMKLEVEEGLTILQAAEKNGIKIPTLCYNKALPAYGACRLCLVEISQNGGSATTHASCTYPVRNGLFIETNTDDLRNTRKMMVELMLAKCPESEILHDLSAEMGVGKPRIKPKNDDCILCGLCVRMCESRMGRGAIGFAHRGFQRVVETAFDMQSEDCQTCGACDYICPTKKGIKFDKITENKVIPILSEFDEGLVRKPAINIPFPQAVPNYAKIDPDYCVQLNTGECKICTEYCEADAINFDHQEEILDLNVGSIIVANGAEKFDPTIIHEYGFGSYKNVLTSIQFERVLSASGPYGGHLQRPSDGKVPTKIAWIQCVGSRTEHSHMPYCSSVCCMYALKEAVIAKEHLETVEPTIFFMDIRAYGKDFDKYYDQAKRTGVRFVRSRVGKINEIKESGNLELYYTKDNGDLEIEEFDLIVLSVGLKPREDIIDITDKLGIRLNKFGFIENKGFSSTQTTRPGVYVCGPAVSPKDIPETVIQASGSVSGAAGILSEVRGTEIEEKVYPEEIDVIGKEPRIGVFICHCGINIGSVVDVPSVSEYAKTLPNVVFADHNLFTCSQDTQEKIKDLIKEHNLNRIVVASCTPRTHEPLFQNTIREAGLNKYLFVMSNIREHCSWVHKDIPEIATAKAKDLVRMAIAKAQLVHSLEESKIDVIRKCLVIGGGIAGMTAAESLANQGFEVSIIEREKELGGNARNLFFSASGDDIRKDLKQLIGKIEDHKNIEIYKEATIESIGGHIGEFKTTVSVNNVNKEIESGVIIVATGAQEAKPEEYLFDEEERVITQLDLEKMLSTSESNDKKPDIQKMKSVVMIQCVGSRDEQHPYCSRVCCVEAVKNAIALKEQNPQINVFILYREIRTYGLYEEFYRKARDLGIIFIRYEVEKKPVVEKKDDSLLVRVFNPLLEGEIEIDPDLIVLAPAIVPRDDASQISQFLKIPLNNDRFYLEAHVKLRPVDFSTEGIYVAGLAHAPKNISESIAQALAASSRAGIVLSKGFVTIDPIVSSVTEDKCIGCGLCVSICANGAVELQMIEGGRKAQVISSSCKGCGTCGSSCPQRAITMEHFTDDEIFVQLEALVGN